MSDTAPPLVILVDSREQLPYSDLFNVPHVIGTVPSGDYSVPGATHLVVEGTIDDVVSGRFGRSNVNPNAVFETLATFSIRYDLPIWFAQSREIGARLVQSLLGKWLREHTKTLSEIRKATRHHAA